VSLRRARRRYASCAATRLFLAVCLPVLFSLHAAFAAAETGVVLEAVDGDTLRVRVGGEPAATVRLIGIDAPERSHPSLGKQFYGDEAAAYLSSLCLGRTVRMERDGDDTDKYGRLLRYLVLPPPDGRLLNLEMVRAGMARTYTRFPFSRQDAFLAAERLARREGRGLWKDGGMAEARWLASGNGAAVAVYPSGGRRYVVAYAGVCKPGVERSELPKEIAWLLLRKAELSEPEFARKARDRGYRFLDPGKDRPSAGRPPPEPSVPRGETAVPWNEAGSRVGTEIVVEGTIVRSHRAASALYLNFHPNWKRYVTVVILAEDLPKFPVDPESAFRGKKIRVRGEVTLFRDRPEMIVRDPVRITVVP
jgi:endonuclease YncB( thermonuclease family)